jgi:hypothetical protein
MALDTRLPSGALTIDDICFGTPREELLSKVLGYLGPGDLVKGASSSSGGTYACAHFTPCTPPCGPRCTR